jgi:hypothetical protein
VSFLIDLLALLGAKDRLDQENDPATEEEENPTFDAAEYPELDD